MSEENITDLLAGIEQFLKKKQNQRQSGGEFNAFEMAQIGSEETRHSAIIAALLEPHGTLGLGIKPLQAFFRHVGLEKISQLCTSDTKVDTEYSIIGRRMDIVIQNENFCVVIENKTNTVDHEQQLADYRNWLNQQNIQEKALLYLTYRGAQAINYYGGDYTAISYKKEICNWLRECALMAEDKKANAIFCSQYCDFITNVLLREKDKMDENVLKEISSHFEAAVEIAKRFDETKAWLLNQNLTPALKNVGFRVIENDISMIMTGRGLDYNVEKEINEEETIQFQFDHYYFWGSRIKIILNKNFISKNEIPEFILPEGCKNNNWRIESKTDERIILVNHEGYSWGNDFFVSLSKDSEREKAIEEKVKQYNACLEKALAVIDELKKLKQQ